MDKEEIDKICDFYMRNNMKEVRRICDKIFLGTNIPKKYMDDYYGKAVEVLVESIKSYDKSRKCKFNTYYYGNLLRRRETWKRNNFRLKRCNLETDKKGKIKRDKKGNPTIISDISVHMKVNPDEDYTLEESISSGFNLEHEVINKICPTTDKVEMYKRNLSYKQQKAVDLICSGYTQEEIIKELNMTEREYKDKILEPMRLYENVKILLRK